MGKLVHWGWVVGALLPLSACGDDPQPSDPHRDCRDFVDAWCDKNAGCSLPSERARVREDCHFVLELDVDCARVVQVSESYPSCIYAIAQSSCDSNGTIAFPPNCRGVLLK